jgi:hypothetical protein
VIRPGDRVFFEPGENHDGLEPLERELIGSGANQGRPAFAT